MEIVVALICLVGPAAAVAVVSFFFWRRSRREIADIAARLAIAETSAIDAQRQQWLATVPGQTYRNEIEVETKFIGPLVSFVGYTPNQIALRVPIAVQVGRSAANGQADWVLYVEGRPRVVIEAKGPGQSLNGAVQGQARSYAYALNASTYLLTNGATVEVYRRGVQTDERLLAFPVAEIAGKWTALAAAIAPPDNYN